MESFGIKVMVDLMQAFGLPGLLFIVWHFDRQRYDELLRKHDKEMAGQNERTLSFLVEMRGMYDSNVELVKTCQKQQAEGHDLLVLVAQSLQRMQDDIRGNQYCPNVRLKKDSVGAMA